MNKKNYIIFLLGVLLFTACGEKNENKKEVEKSEKQVETNIVLKKEKLVDGYYFVQDKTYFKGWLTNTSITVKEGEIVEVIYDKVDKEGISAMENKKYSEDMFAKVGTSPTKFFKQLPENFMRYLKDDEDDNFDFSKIDIVAGATHSSMKFRKMIKFLVEKAEEGKVGEYKQDF